MNHDFLSEVARLQRIISRQATMWGFEWRKSSTRCGLHVPNVTVAMSGQWKCHMANTDSQELEKIR